MSDQFFTMDGPSHIIRILPVMYKKFATHRLEDGSYENCPRLVAKPENGECPLCDHYNRLWQEIAGEPQNASSLRNEARTLKPTLQYYVPIIDRVNPQAGPKILKMSEVLFQKILAGMIQHPSAKPRPKWYQLWTKIKNWWNGVRYATSTLDEHEGLDFMIFRNMKGLGGGISFPDYSRSDYINDPKPIGTPEETARWKEEATKMMEDLKQSPFVKKI